MTTLDEVFADVLHVKKPAVRKAAPPIRPLAELQKSNMAEHGRQLVRRRGLEDHLSIIRRAVYHLRNLKGGYIPNERFEQQFASLYAGQIKFDRG